MVRVRKPEGSTPDGARCNIISHGLLYAGCYECRSREGEAQVTLKAWRVTPASRLQYRRVAKSAERVVDAGRMGLSTIAKLTCWFKSNLSGHGDGTPDYSPFKMAARKDEQAFGLGKRTL